MHRRPSRWTRALTLYRASDPGGGPGPAGEALHARSVFRSRRDPDCYAVYSIRAGTGARAGAAGPDGAAGAATHTLVAVREFRRVPLDASSLALLLFLARPGRTPSLVAALADWVEHAVSLYQPTYLLLAHSLERPRVTALLAGVRERRALQWARPAALSLDALLPEVVPWLVDLPEVYLYCPDPGASDPVLSPAGAVSPRAV